MVMFKRFFFNPDSVFSGIFISTLVLVLMQACTGDVKPVNQNADSEKSGNTVKPENSVPTIPFTLVKILVHDTNSFTEGLLFHNKQMYESTGATDNLPQTRSLFGVVDPKTGKIDVKA